MLYFGAIIPFTILVILNFMIIYKATQFSRLNKPTTADEIKRVRKRTEMIKMIIFITFLYIIVELPCFVFNGYFYSVIIVFDIGPSINALFNNIEFSYPAFNLFILYTSNKLFANKFKQFFGFNKRRAQVGNSTSQPLKPTSIATNKRDH